MSNANSRQVAGNHYVTADPNLGHWDYVIHALKNRYLEGQVTKYLFRWRKKNGRQDLEKCAHYLQKLREAFAAGLVKPQRYPLTHVLRLQDYKPPFPAAQCYAGDFDLLACYEANALTATEREVTDRIIIWRYADDLEVITSIIDSMLAVVCADHD